MEIDRAFLGHLVIVFNLLIFLYVLFIQTTYLSFIVLSFRGLLQEAWTNRSREVVSLEHAEVLPPISLIVPAYNESVTIAESVKAFMHLAYPQYEIIVVNDGSKDDTLEVLKEAYQLVKINQVFAKKLETKQIRNIYHSLSHPELIVIDKENGGKADAINAGINVSRYPLFCVVDADSLLEEQALIEAAYPFIENPDEVVAVGGTVRIANGCTIDKGRVTEVRLSKKHWPRIQVLEYLRAFLVGRTAMSTVNGLLIIAGAFGVFKKSAVVEVGGYLTNTVGEDAELTVRLHRYRYENKKNWRIHFAPRPVCWTQAPEDRQTLRGQRNRWHRGLAETLWRHRKMFMNPRYGVVGMFSMPYFVFVEWLGPVIEVIGFISIPLAYLFGLLNVWFATAFFAASLIYGLILSLGALLLEEQNFRRYSRFSEILMLFIYSIVENFYFRPLNSWWKTVATFQVRKKKHAWGEMKRQTFQDPPSNPPSIGA
ncbi:glycosyltransferase family 2 protein [Brevibacillus dissolubilis]|uniref:glycosyltransferase family 2 protein n=1 Tax=Brevibacillus dissolubilis TaxID=1844116 RepID=UPI0011176433|nr:glycosyltransferase [Brevibacillus dissolubilis]